MDVLIMKDIMGLNQELAEENRSAFKKQGVLTINVMASPGAGKTSVITRISEAIGKDYRIGVIEGDIASSIDADKIQKMGLPVVQINTGGECHLDANMIKAAAKRLPISDLSLLMIENVGNLVCPCTFDLGEDLKLVVASVAEGDDKPYKYPAMFQAADIIVLNKTDLLPYVDFEMGHFYKGVKALNQNACVFGVSCKTGSGLDLLIEYLINLLSMIDRDAKNDAQLIY